METAWRKGARLARSLRSAVESLAGQAARSDILPRRGRSGSSNANETGSGGEEVFGYNSRFAQELANLGQLTLADFATNGASIPYLAQLSWDPTTAQFWTNFNSTNLLFLQYGGGASSPTNLPYNFHLNSTESALFMTNGFVVSERLGSATFGDAYYRVFNADLPVFVSADSVLHAWHRSYQSMMEELEELEMSTLLERVISNMSLQLPQTWQKYGQGPLHDSILDADYFLTVARSLWSAQQVASALGDASVDQRVNATLTAINSLALQDDFMIFGTNRPIDFSQFTVRGHYDASDRLRRYFRTMMWCGRIDLRLATFWPNQEYDIRELGTAVVMHHLLQQAGQFYNWSSLEQITRVFVGVTDSMTFAQLGDLLAEANISSPADIPDLLTITNLQTRLLTGELGVQGIHGDFLYSPFSPEQVKLPRSFTLCGQKFVVDSWAFSQVVFDRILWSPDDWPRIIFGKVIRRKPSCLDVAFSVLGNDAVVPDIVARISNTNGVSFRDGLPYQHNLLAVRRVLDSQAAQTWSDNIYTAWLKALRALSGPTTDASYPEAMRTRAWAMKNLNAQLGSWTELRHDTLLYAKQSYTEPLLCAYPFGFVEPRPEFWQHMNSLAQITAAAISGLPMSGQVTTISRNPSFPIPIPFDLAAIQANEVSFLTNFAAQMSILQTIAEKELAQEPLSQSESDFLKNIIERTIDYTGFRHWNGWYPQIFYANVLSADFLAGTPASGCDVWDPMVADVHTDLPDPIVGDPGAVIHEGIGNVPMLLIAVDNGPDRMVYAGPVLSHYEVEVQGVSRLTDVTWKTSFSGGQEPPPPEWTQSYFVPGLVIVPPGYQ